MSRTAVALAALLTAGAVSVPAGASAGTWVGADPAGDVYGVRTTLHGDDCPTSTTLDASEVRSPDIRRVGVRHTRRAVTVGVRLAGLNRHRDHSIWVVIRTPRGAWDLDVGDGYGAHGKKTLFADLTRHADPPDDPTASPCVVTGVMTDGVACDIDAAIDRRTRTVSAVVPRRCLRSPRWVQVSVETSDYRYADDHQRFTTFWDVWGGASDALAPFGPRVPVRPGRVR